MDEDGCAWAFVWEPYKSDAGPHWCTNERDCSLRLGYVPLDLRLWAWGEFLLRFSDVSAWRLESAATERVVWMAPREGQAMRLRVAIVEEPLPSPQEVAHWRVPTDEEVDEMLGVSWTDNCPVEI
jgi:hypothetical protein